MSEPNEHNSPATLEAILKSKPQDISPEPDDKTENERLSIADEAKRIANTGLQQDIEERRKYAHRNFCLVSIWLAAVGAILLFQGFKVYAFDLSAEVLITLIGSTTASIVGIFVIVTKYLFPSR